MAARGACSWAVAVVFLAALAGFVAPSSALGSACSLSADDGYMGACGPRFVVPTWGDGGGWDDPSKYATIRLADVNGDGRDELLARNDQGIEVWTFDTGLGQWRPQVDANDVPQALTDFRSPKPGEDPATDWTQPQYASTIRFADVDGRAGVEVLGRFEDGMRIYKYTPPAGTTDIDGGSWALLRSGGPFANAPLGYSDPSLYLPLGVDPLGQLDQTGAHPTLWSRSRSDIQLIRLVRHRCRLGAADARR